MPHGSSFFEITAILGQATLLAQIGISLLLFIGGARKIEALKQKAPL
ncbi:MAG: hypothetical protein HZB87_13605 [Desulfatitalea sp.]|nr:hypothetical protein [Desulfatitalea sp.]